MKTIASSLFLLSSLVILVDGSACSGITNPDDCVNTKMFGIYGCVFCKTDGQCHDVGSLQDKCKNGCCASKDKHSTCAWVSPEDIPADCSSGAPASDAGIPLCLPNEFSTLYHKFSDTEEKDIHHFRPREFREGDFLHIFADLAEEKTKVYIHQEAYSKDPEYGVLTDYKQGLRWTWSYDPRDRKVFDCQLEKHDDKIGRFCVSDNAEKRGDLYLGKNLHVDAYDEKSEDKEKGVFEEVETLMEYGSASLPVSQKVRGRFLSSKEQKTYFVSEEWYDFSVAPLSASTFEVPSECPK